MITPEQMARLHHSAFAGHARTWSADEFAALIDSPHVFACGDARAFALCRVIVDEGEILTLATSPGEQRKGHGARILAALEAEATARGARTVFLEVAADNAAARALYARAGYGGDGRRAGYYSRPGGDRVDALILRKVLI